MAAGNENLRVVIAHDYQCPWCYLSFFQAKKLGQEFPQISQEWRGYELLPEAKTSDATPRPQPSERFTDLVKMDGLPMPTSWPAVTNSHDALEGAEFIKQNFPELFDKYNEGIYRGFWEDGIDISDHKILANIAEQIGADQAKFLAAITERKYAKEIIPFKEAAYADGITHVTTFRFLGEQCAEASYQAIGEMAKRHIAWYES